MTARQDKAGLHVVGRVLENGDSMSECIPNVYHEICNLPVF